MGSCPRCHCPTEPLAACASAREPCAAALAPWPEGLQLPRHSAEQHSLQHHISPVWLQHPLSIFLNLRATEHMHTSVPEGLCAQMPCHTHLHSAMIFAEDSLSSDTHRCDRGTPRQELMLQETLGAPPACLEWAPPVQHTPHVKRSSSCRASIPGCPMLQPNLGCAVHCMFPTIGTLDRGRFTTKISPREEPSAEGILDSRTHLGGQDGLLPEP